MRTLCLGEALADLVCERPVQRLADADCFVPHAGGAVANVAVVARRCGARVALGGGVGDDAWGHWLIDRLRAERIDLDWFAAVPGVATPVAFVTLNEQSEPEFAVYGHGIPEAMLSLAPRLEQAVDACDALFFGSNTLVGKPERELTLRAVELARAAGKPFLFDPNFRLHRWGDRAQAVELVRAACDGALMVKVNRDEAQLLTGCDEPVGAADAIHALGARAVVVTLGPDGALARGEVQADVDGVAASPVDTTGAGDVVAGVLLAALMGQHFDVSAIGSALPAAVEAAARSTEDWGAVDALPDPMPAVV